MTEFSIICFNGVSICLALWNFISTQVIPKPIISVKPITVVLFRFRRLVNDTLDCFLGAYPDYCPAQNTSGFAVYNSQNVDSVFLTPMNVKISSISASLTSSGTGAFDKASARSVSHDETVCGETFRWRAIRRRYRRTFRLPVFAGSLDTHDVSGSVCTCLDSAYTDTIANPHRFYQLYSGE